MAGFEFTFTALKSGDLVKSRETLGHVLSLMLFLQGWIEGLGGA